MYKYTRKKENGSKTISRLSDICLPAPHPKMRGLTTGIPNPDKPEKKTFNHDGNNGALPCKEHRPGGKP
jgi:hypothetical protein